MRRILLGIMSAIVLVILFATPGDNITGSAVQIISKPAYSIIIIGLIFLMLGILVLRITRT